MQAVRDFFNKSVPKYFGIFTIKNLPPDKQNYQTNVNALSKFPKMSFFKKDCFSENIQQLLLSFEIFFPVII